MTRESWVFRIEIACYLVNAWGDRVDVHDKAEVAIAMSIGFEHFDGAHRENFIAGSILLLMGLDDEARHAIGLLVRQKAVLEPAPVRDYGREVSLGRDEDGKRWRSDLWIRFGDGTVLVEVKTHSNWPLEDVTKQHAAQRRSKAEVGGAPVIDAVLLAPPTLKRAAPDRYLSWTELQDCVRALPSATPIRQTVLRHWEDNVEKTYGLPLNDTAGISELARAARVVSCLRAFLQASVTRVARPREGGVRRRLDEGE